MKANYLFINGWLLLFAAGYRSALMGCVGTGTGLAEAGRVTRVVDGDTYDVLAGGVVYRVRLVGADAPELSQPFGRQAADSVAALLPRGRAVWLRRMGKDVYGRTLGVVRLPLANGRLVALDSLLVARGCAWAWAPAHRVAHREAEQLAAQQVRRGLWGCDQAAVPPLLWRRFDAATKRRYGAGCWR